ncbi:MAG: hypothetical protein KDC95_21360 [Planctomycetes bacterium]|nr:hypothetical protein [Planctomycetota bacterium]
MRKSTLSLLGVGIMAGALSAQAAPGEVSAHADSKTFARTNFENLNIYLSTATTKYLAQIMMSSRAGLGAGKAMVGMTVYGLDQAYGNTGQSTTGDFVLAGEYDYPTDKFTPNTHGNAMNDVAAGNFGLMISGPLGQYAVVDHSDGVYFSKRANFTQAFPAPVKVGGITSTYVDPAVTIYQGQLKLLWVESYTDPVTQLGRSRIAMNDLDDSNWPTSVTIKGNAQIIADVTLSSSTDVVNVHSPTPVVDQAGNLCGLMCSERVGSDSDQFFKGDIQMGKGHEQQRYYDGSAWTNNGGCYFGTLYYADSEATVTPFYDTIKEHGLAWLAIADVPVNGSGNMIMANKDTNAGPNVTVVYLSDTVIPAVAIPGIGGKLGINPGVVIPFGAAAHTDASERAQIGISIPNDPTLKGKSFPMQGLVIDPAAGTNPTILTFTNTAFLNVL